MKFYRIKISNTNYLFELTENIILRNFALQCNKKNSRYDINTTCLYEIVQNIFFINFELQGEKHSNSTAITSIFNDGIRNLCNYIGLVYMCKWYNSQSKTMNSVICNLTKYIGLVDIWIMYKHIFLIRINILGYMKSIIVLS